MTHARSAGLDVRLRPLPARAVGRDRRRPPERAVAQPLPGALAFVGLGTTVAGCVAVGLRAGIALDALAAHLAAVPAHRGWCWASWPRWPRSWRRCAATCSRARGCVSAVVAVSPTSRWARSRASCGRPCWSPAIFGVVAVGIACCWASPHAGLGIIIGVAAAVLNVRMLAGGVTKVETDGRADNKVVRKILRTRSAAAPGPDHPGRDRAAAHRPRPGPGHGDRPGHLPDLVRPQRRSRDPVGRDRVRSS